MDKHYRVTKTIRFPISQELADFLDGLKDKKKERQVIEHLITIGTSCFNGPLLTLSHNPIKSAMIGSIEHISSRIKIRRLGALLEVGTDTESEFNATIFGIKDAGSQRPRPVINHIKERAKITEENKKLFDEFERLADKLVKDIYFIRSTFKCDPLSKLYTLLGDADFSKLVRDILMLENADKEDFYRFFELYTRLVPKPKTFNQKITSNKDGDSEWLVAYAEYGLYTPMKERKGPRSLWNKEEQKRSYIPCVNYVVYKETTTTKNKEK